MLRKRSLSLAGHTTSLALEPAFWDVLEAIAANISSRAWRAAVAENAFNRLLSIFDARRARKFPPSALSAVAVTLLSMWHACRHAGFAHHQFLAKIVDDPDVRPTSCKQARRSFPRQVGRQAARGQDRCAGAVVHAVGHLRASSDWVLQANRRGNGPEPPWLPCRDASHGRQSSAFIASARFPDRALKQALAGTANSINTQPV
jgi:hypothetical protein